MPGHDTVLKAFLANVEATPDKLQFTQPNGSQPVQTWTMKQVLDEAKKMAGYLESKNYPKGSKIAICSKNCAWWVIADLASKYKTLSRCNKASFLKKRFFDGYSGASLL